MKNGVSQGWCQNMRTPRCAGEDRSGVKFFLVFEKVSLGWLSGVPLFVWPLGQKKPDSEVDQGLGALKIGQRDFCTGPTATVWVRFFTRLISGTGISIFILCERQNDVSFSITSLSMLTQKWNNLLR